MVSACPELQGQLHVSQADGLIYVSGMTAFSDGKLIKGIVGDSIDAEQAAFAARQT